MNKPYLIQRAKFTNNDSRKGIDAILRFDYMGSAEFEFGALPASLKRIRASINDYTQFQYSFKNNPTKLITVFCKKEQQGLVGEILEELKDKKLRLKEFCDLGDWVNPKEHSSNRNDFWWDIENDWMFWKYTPEFDLKFKQALTNV